MALGSSTIGSEQLWKRSLMAEEQNEWKRLKTDVEQMGAAAAVIICSCVFGSPNEKLFVTDDDYVLN